MIFNKKNKILYILFYFLSSSILSILFLNVFYKEKYFYTISGFIMILIEASLSYFVVGCLKVILDYYFLCMIDLNVRNKIKVFPYICFYIDTIVIRNKYAYKYLFFRIIYSFFSDDRVLPVLFFSFWINAKIFYINLKYNNNYLENLINIDSKIIEEKDNLKDENVIKKKFKYIISGIFLTKYSNFLRKEYKLTVDKEEDKKIKKIYNNNIFKRYNILLVVIKLVIGILVLKFVNDYFISLVYYNILVNLIDSFVSCFWFNSFFNRKNLVLT